MNPRKPHIGLNYNLFHLFNGFFLPYDAFRQDFFDILDGIVVEFLPRIILLPVFEKKVKLLKRHFPLFTGKTRHLYDLAVGEVVEHIDVFIFLLASHKRFARFEFNVKSAFDFFEHFFTFQAIGTRQRHASHFRICLIKGYRKHGKLTCNENDRALIDFRRQILDFFIFYGLAEKRQKFPFVRRQLPSRCKKIIRPIQNECRFTV